MRDSSTSRIGYSRLDIEDAQLTTLPLPMPLRPAFAFILCLSSGALAQTDSSRAAPIAPLVRPPANTSSAGITVIDSAEIAASAAPTLSELLQARRPGLRVLRSGGLASDGALVMLRGPKSLIGSSEPIVIVDGVRVDSRQFDQPLDLGGTAPSHLDDLMPEDIARIEVLSGAAAALYGDGAANGVILVTTKSGGPGPLRLTERVSWSATQNNTEFPANYQRLGTSPTTGQPVANCSLVSVAAGTCVPTALHVWNPLEQASPFRTGSTALGRLALGGSAFGTSLFAAVTGNASQGVLPRDGIDRIGGRAKLSRDLPGHFSVEANGGFLRGHARFAVDGNAVTESNVIANGLVGSAEDNANRGYLDFGSAAGGDSVFPSRRLSHGTGGVTLTWRPVTWLTASAMTGRDLVTEHWHEDHIGQQPQPALDHLYVESHYARNSAATLTSSYHVGFAIGATTTVGLEQDVQRTADYDSVADSTGPFGITESRLYIRSTSFHVTETVFLPREIQANVSAERVTSRIFGGDEWFPSASASWSPAVDRRGVSHLRLRAAYAEAPGASISLLSIRIVTPPFSAVPPRPTMERTKSVELGAEATIASLAQLELTAFSDRSTRLWATNVPTAFGPADEQIGTMTNKGIETLLRANLLDVGSIRWDGTLSLAVLRNRVVGLTTPPPLGSLQNPVSNGYALGGVWAQTYTYADLNHDGIIGTNEVQLGPTQYAGSPLPTLESSFASELAMPGHVVITALLDYRHGNRAVDLTGSFRCSIVHCRETQDPTAPLDLQAAAVASRLSNFSPTGFISDASFMRLREIAIRWTLPRAGSRYLGTDADLTVAGRNLATWTNYRGLDPEISYQPPDILPRQEFLTMPIPREVIVRLDLRP